MPCELELIGEICSETMLSIHDWNVVEDKIFQDVTCTIIYLMVLQIAFFLKNYFYFASEF